ncbi:MAG TPA: ABC transporter ATP-binding protein [Anaerolineae bacterium]|nr:ABC transporter ATP-binding protein [Anaerolineae bacterium]HQI83831.1 ABC transporter ATP-binding protein [Anaerolineae bacterium]
MAEPIIVFDHVSKTFDLHRGRSRSFQELLVNFGRWRQPRVHDDLHALQDISFTIERGTTVGFIGANGAGKSTLLKLIARILEPDSGTVTVNGRVGALLELGAGFHPDLTGRENVYLNASIMGLDRREVDRRFDEIVAFSELERFIDVPVKHYSSGMYVRLGFAVAVNMRPEILLVDEVLAVGDQAFQHKCMGRMAQLKRSDTTIVYVSHTLSTLQTFCDSAIWLDDGIIQSQGNITNVVMDYLKAVAQKEESAAKTGKISGNGRWGTGKVQIIGVELCDKSSNPVSVFETGELMEVVLHYRADERVEHPIFGLAIYQQNGMQICGPNTQFGELTIPSVEGEGKIVYQIPDLSLLEGAYQISVAVIEALNGEVYDYHDRLYSFRVYRGQCLELDGVVTLRGKWQMKALEAQSGRTEAQ